jgi:flagellar basal-body rod protein FlgB
LINHTLGRFFVLIFKIQQKEVFCLEFKLDHTFQVLEASLNGSAARQKAIAHNVSNVNTPGFKSYLVDFEDQLKSMGSNYQEQLPLKTTSPKHISIDDSAPDLKIERDNSAGQSADGNNVDLEKEMTLMVKNDVYFNAALNQANKKIAMLKYVISDGRG